MIRVNLLPIEKRKTERTPVPRLMLICANAAALLLLAAGAVMIWMKFNEVQNDIQRLKARQAQLAPQVKIFNKLTTEKANLQRKVNEIEAVIRREPEGGFWYAINGLWDVINAHPKVWINDLRILDERAVQGEVKRSELGYIKPPPPYGVTFQCNVAGREVSEMTKFREALKNHPVLQETLYYINFDVQWSVKDDDEFDEPYSLEFDITLFGPSQKPKVKKKTDKPEEQPTETPAGGTQE